MRNIVFKEQYKLEFMNSIGPVGMLGLNSDSSLDQLFERFTQDMDERDMPSIQSLRERRVELNKQLQSIVNRATAENRNLTEDESQQYRQNTSEDREIVAQIELQEAQAEAAFRNGVMTQSMSPVGMPGTRVLHAPGSNNSVLSDSFLVTDQDFALGSMIASNSGRTVDAQDWDRAERGGYRAGMDSMTINLPTIRPTPGNHVLFSHRNAMSTKVPGKGGAWVSPSSSGRFEIALKQFGPMIETSEVIVTSSGEDMKWPTLNDTSYSSILVGENQQVPETDMMTSAQLFGAHKVSTGLLKVSNETLADSIVDVAAEVQTAFGTRLGRGLNRLFTLGETPNGPRGIVPSAPVGKVTASGTVVTADELIDLIASVDPAYASQPGAGWLMHPQVFAAISKLRDSQGNFLSGNLESGIVPKLRGYPVHLNSDMSSTFSAGEKIALFGSLRSYRIRFVGQQRVFRLVEKFADFDQTGFVMFWRADGALLDAGTHPVKALQLKP